jgi:hypothetical protein
MQKLYKIVMATLIVVLLFSQNRLQAQKCCVECQADVKSIADKQVLLEKIDIKQGTVLTNFSTNVYVSYRSGNAQKFWANVAIATAGVAVSTQLNSSPVTAGDSRTQSAISPIVPLGVTVATLPSIWKNRPRGVPQAGLYIQHRNKRGNLLNSWEQPISNEAKNSAELLIVAIDKPLTEGTLDVYLQNGSKNEVYYWGEQTLNEVIKNNKIALTKPDKPVVSGDGGSPCPPGWLILYDPQTHEVNGCAREKDSGELDEVIVVPNPQPYVDPFAGQNNNGNPNDPDHPPVVIDPGGGGSSNGSVDEDKVEYKTGSLDWDPISKPWANWIIESNESGFVKRSTKNPQWKVYQDIVHNSLRINGTYQGTVTFSLIRTPHTHSFDTYASIGLFINVVESTTGWFGLIINSADDYERQASWSANQIAQH